MSRSYVNEKLPGTWFGSRGNVWNGLLKGLSPLDFLFWGVKNDDVYAPKFINLSKFGDVHQARSTEDRE